MAFCVNYNKFQEFLHKINQTVEIDKNKEKDLRYDVWSTTSKQVSDLINKGVDSITWDENKSRHIKSRIEAALKRVDESPESASDFVKDIINDEDGNNIEYSIALHELMESVKGEADKARNLGIEISEISNDGILPSLPLSRIAASIGRKIAYQKGYRFKSQKINESTPAEIETLYYGIGKLALSGLELKGYVKLQENLSTIKDYIEENELKKEFPKTNIKTDKVLSVSLTVDKLGIKPGTAEVYYFLNRSESDITDTKLGTITDIMRAVKQVTQPAEIALPDTKIKLSKKQLAENDDPNIVINPITEEVRKSLYDKPLYVNKSIHSLITLLNKESLRSGRSASQIVKDKFNGHPTLINSLFGLKRSDDFSIDKKESVAGQNLSKTTPLDDLVDNYDAIQGDSTDPVGLHLPMKVGRNDRLYYVNSVLNAHGSKQSRYMLTAGSYTVDTGSADYDYLVHQLSETLGDSELSYGDFTGRTKSKLDEALKILSDYESASTLQKKLVAISNLSVMFPGTNYVSLITALKGVSDIRNPEKGKVVTEFMASADATASGGTLTFLQALGTNPNVEKFLQRIGMLKQDDGSVKVTLGDLYGLMTESINKFVKGEPIENMIGQDLNPVATGSRLILQDTVKLLFDEGKSTRELSKDPTMTFVYGQGRKGATDTMARSLADRIIDNLDDKSTREYLVRLLGKDYANIESSKLKNTKDLYKSIVSELKSSGLVNDLYNIMDASINQEFLAEFKDRSDKLFKLVKKVKSNVPFKVLPAGAVISGIKPTFSEIKKYGMPLTKVFEVSSTVPTGTDTVLTQKQKLTKTVADVSTIHSIDAAQLYHSMMKLDSDKGSVVVHDDYRGSVQDVRAMESLYRETTVDIVKNYDIQQQILNSIAAYDPELSKSAEFQALKIELDSNMETKKQIIEEKFNDETDALIGNGNEFNTFAGKTEEKTKGLKSNNKPAVKNKTPEPVSMAMEIMQELESESPIIARFMEQMKKGEGSVKNADNNIDMYVPDIDAVQLTGNDNTGTKLDISKPADRKAQRELIEHEITHANTTGYIQKALMPENRNTQEGRDVRYFKKVADILRKDINSMTNAMKMGESYHRISYIAKQPTEAQQIAEMVAILNAEPEVAKDLYTYLAKEHGNIVGSEKSLKARIKRFIDKVVKAISNVTESDLVSDTVDIDKLYTAIMNTTENGLTQREEYYQEARKYQKAFHANLPFGEGGRKPVGNINYLNYAVASMLNSKLERKGKRLFGTLHSMMKETFPVYTDAVNKVAGIYDDSSALQEILHTITGEGVNKSKKADILAKFAKVMADQVSVVNEQMGKFKELLYPLSDTERKTIGRFVTEMPLQDYFALASEFDTKDAIASEVVRLEAELIKVAPKAIKEVNGLIAWNVTQEEKKAGKIYNLEAGSVDINSDVGRKVRKLLALKSIQTIGATEFEAFLENTDLVNLVKDQVMANKLSLTENRGTHLLKDSMIMDYYKNPVVTEVVELRNFKRFQNGDSGNWKVLVTPTEDTLGVIYEEIIDSTKQLGAYTDIKLHDTDITVDKSMAKYKGVVKTKDGFKLRLTKEQKIELGLVEDFSQELVRSTAHNMAIQDSQIIRDSLLKKDTWIEIGSKPTKLIDIIKSDNVDNPWFMKLEDGVTLDSMDAESRKLILSKYKAVGTRVSNVSSFDESVDFVRKDISHWLMGGSAESLFKNPRYKWAVRILKDFIASAKINMVVLNPIKIANDNISNIAYLGVMGATPWFIAKNYKDITRDFQEFSDLQRQIINHKVELVSNPENEVTKKKVEHLQEQLKMNPLGDLTEKGFINSLGSDLVAKNADTLSGLQADIHTALEYLLTKDGKKNYVGHFITKLQNVGGNGEDFLNYIGQKAKKTGKTGRGFEKSMDEIASRLKEIRTEEDVVSYVAQYTTSPGSELVRLGATMTDLTDVMAKETLYRYLTQIQRMSPEDAKITVLDSFPDYKENMPMAIRQLSDLGIIMFPSFWLRIQKVIYRMARDKPVNLGVELLMEEMIGSNFNSIMDANIIAKYNSFGGILHTPLESTNLF